MTRKQRQLYEFLKTYIKENDGVSPSYEEMKVALNLKSKSGIFRLIEGLKDRGYIEKLPHRARTVEIVKRISVQPVTIQNFVTDTVWAYLAAKGLQDDFSNYVSTLRRSGQ